MAPNQVADSENQIEQIRTLHLDLPDDELIRHINRRISQSVSWYENEKDLYTRQKKNLDYLLGKQINFESLKHYQAKYVDNLVYEAESTIKPIALSRLPDLLVKPGKDEDESKDTADDITKIINNDIRKRENRQVLGLAFKHLPIYFLGAIKAFWNPEKGEEGNYQFKAVHPDNLVLDHTATTQDPQDMDFVGEAVELSVKEIIMRFPNKKDDILKEVGFREEMGGKDKEKLLASKIKIWEIWFTWWENTTDPDTGEDKYERIEGVIWKYKNLVLNKMRNPYWDWTGERRIFTYDLKGKREVGEDELRQLMFGEDEFDIQTVFHNHFRTPRKPYIFLGYDQLGRMPYDETSRIEQVLYLQDNVNKRGRQITEMNDRARGKHIFSTDAIGKDDVEKMDLADPTEDVMVDGDVRLAHDFIPGEAAPQQLYAEQANERSKAFSKMGTHATTRGEQESDVATTNQILREQDFGKIDDIVEETINHAAEQMSNWAMQFIKLFYTRSHMRRIVGKSGDVAFMKVNRDKIEDGMEVVVTASGVDKLQRKREALEMARIGVIDPMTFYEDMGVSDPKGRAKRLMLFQAEPLQYLQQVIMDRDISQQAGILQNLPANLQQQPQGQQPQQQPQQGQGGGGFSFGGMGGSGGETSHLNNQLGNNRNVTGRGQKRVLNNRDPLGILS